MDTHRKSWGYAAELRTWRLREQHSLEDAGRRLGISRTQMWRYETGKRRIPPEKVPAVSRITKIPRYKLRPDVFDKPRRLQPVLEQLAVD